MATPVSVLDVAAYILRSLKRCSAMKLQKLCYYAQAWSLVWDDRPLFSERIEAWANGPVIPELWQKHVGQYELTHESFTLGDPNKLDADSRETIDVVLKAYGDRTAQWLSDLTHQEGPWLKARKGLPPTVRSSSEITLASMAEYYGSL